MIRLLLLVAVVAALIMLMAFIAVSLYARHQRRLREFSEDPMLAGLSRKERREYARELRRREQEKYEQKRQQELLKMIAGKP